MKLGDIVICSEYIKPSGNHYEILRGKKTRSGAPVCLYREKGASEENGVEVDDCHGCERYKTIGKTFTGIYVGTTSLCTRLYAEYWDDEYGNSGFRTHCEEPHKFAIVYYADNKKRLVPIERLTLKQEAPT